MYFQEIYYTQFVVIFLFESTLLLALLQYDVLVLVVQYWPFVNKEFVGIHMESDDEEVIPLWWLRRIKKRRRFWIHPLINSAQSNYMVAKDLNGDPDTALATLAHA